MRDARYATLDAMRGIAAIAVMMWHTPDGARLVPAGHLAVDFFFALSGFVISMAYQDRMRAGLSAGVFLRLRIARLWPMLALAALPSVLAGGWAGSLVLVPDIRSTSLFPLLPTYWSLLFEMAAYVAFAFGLYRLTTRVLCLLLLGSCVAYVSTAFSSGILMYEYGAFWFSIPHGLVRLAFPFLFGMILFRVTGKGRAYRTTPLAWLAPLAMLALMAFVPGDDNRLVILAVLLGMPAIVWLAVRWEVPHSRLAGWLSDLSYPLYCIHITGLLVLDQYDVPAPLAWLALAGLALYLDRIWDRPVRAWLRDVLASGRSRQVTVRPS